MAAAALHSLRPLFSNSGYVLSQAFCTGCCGEVRWGFSSQPVAKEAAVSAAFFQAEQRLCSKSSVKHRLLRGSTWGLLLAACAKEAAVSAGFPGTEQQK
jgi:hypothetical protein